jgi:hypothetical protein
VEVRSYEILGRDVSHESVLLESELEIRTEIQSIQEPLVVQYSTATGCYPSTVQDDISRRSI